MKILVLIVISGLLAAENHYVDAAEVDFHGFYFELLLTHLDAFDARVQEQIASLAEQINELKSEVTRTTRAIETKVDNTEKLMEKLTIQQNASTGAIRNELVTLKANIIRECTNKEVFSAMIEQQAMQVVRRIERSSVASGTQQLFVDNKEFNVYVDSTNEHGFGGSWIVFQRRFDGSENFNRGWQEYVNGFGSITGEHWLGLEQLYQILQTGRHELLIVLEDYDGTIGYEHYDNFTLGDMDAFYEIISLGSYVGNAGRSFYPHLHGMFSTFDDDFQDCAKKNAGGWWFKEDNGCKNSYLNGEYHGIGDRKRYGISWFHFGGFENSLKSTKMMVRPHIASHQDEVSG